MVTNLLRDTVANNIGGSRTAPPAPQSQKSIYGLLFVKLDRVGPRDNYVAAYGDILKIYKYKNDFHLKGEVKEYKTQAWLVKRLESLKEQYDEDIKLLFVE